MVADKHKVDAQKAAALGMLAPKTGLSALAKILSDTTSGKSASSVRGATSASYWQKLLANMKPVPVMFEKVMAVPQSRPVPDQQVLSTYVN